MALTPSQVSTIMTANGWTRGARLMEIWARRPSRVAPTYSNPVIVTITMKWALTFARAQSVYDSILLDRIWANSAAKIEVRNMLRANGKLGTRRMSFGNLIGSVPAQHPNYVNQRVVGMSSWGLDDMDAALGRFVFNVLVSGHVEPVSKGLGHTVTIDKVGVYIRDSYDFNGSQSLGYWDPSDNSVSSWNGFSGTHVSNADFRNWRAANGKGGDFLIYSDIKQTVLASPSVFTV